jgi:hypothetical protein
MGRAYDGRDTDSWALGVVLYAIITGQLPFDLDQSEAAGMSEAEERNKKMRLIARGAYVWEEHVGSAGARSVVKRLLERNPRDRCRAGDIWQEAWMSGPGGVVVHVDGADGAVNGSRAAPAASNDESAAATEAADAPYLHLSGREGRWRRVACGYVSENAGRGMGKTELE